MEKRDRLLELTQRSADKALGSLSMFLDHRLGEASRACEWQPADLDRVSIASDTQVLALFADLDGAVGGRLGLLSNAGAARAFLAPLLRTPPGPARQLLECSAWLEAGNVAFSASAGALGDAVGGVVFPSIPRIWLQSDAGFSADLACDQPDSLGAYAVFSSCELEAPEFAGAEIALLWLPTQWE